MPSLTPVDNSWSPGAKPTNDYNPLAHNMESSDPVEHTGNASVTLTMAVQNNDPLANPAPRVVQQQIVPQAVKSRFYNPVTVDGSGVHTVSGFVPAGASAAVYIDIINKSNGLITVRSYFQIYIDNHDVNSRMPHPVSSANYPYYFLPSLTDFDGNSIADTPFRDLQLLQIRNNDANGHLIIVDGYWRIIQNGLAQNVASAT